MALSPFQDGERAGPAGASQVVGAADPQIPVGNLPFPGFASQLQPDLVQLRNPGGPHGMSFGFQPPGGVDRLGAFQAGKPLGRGLVALTGREEP